MKGFDFLEIEEHNNCIFRSCLDYFWEYLGHGGCAGQGWKNIGTARSVEEAREIMLADEECSRDQSVLFYSTYWSWGIKCVTSEQYIDCTDPNENWQKERLWIHGKIKKQSNGILRSYPELGYSPTLDFRRVPILKTTYIIMKNCSEVSIWCGFYLTKTIFETCRHWF